MATIIKGTLLNTNLKLKALIWCLAILLINTNSFASDTLIELILDNRQHLVKTLSPFREMKKRNEFPIFYKGFESLTSYLEKSTETLLDENEKKDVLTLFIRYLPSVNYCLNSTMVLIPDSIVYPFVRTMLVDNDTNIAIAAYKRFMGSSDLTRIPDFKMTAADINSANLSSDKKRDLALFFNVKELLHDTSGMELYQKTWYGDTAALQELKKNLVECTFEPHERMMIGWYVNAWRANDFKTVLKEFNKHYHEISMNGCVKCTSSTFQNEILKGLRRHHPQETLFGPRMDMFMEKISRYARYENGRPYIDSIAVFVKNTYGVEWDSSSLRWYSNPEYPSINGYNYKDCNKKK